MNTINVYRVLLVFLASIIFGACAFLFWVTPYFFATTTLQINRTKTLLNTAALLTYGSVVSVDTTQSKIIVDITNPFNNNQPSRLEYTVAPSAYIARQELQAGPDGISLSLSAAIVSRLAAIQPGDHVAIISTRLADNRLTTDYILYGTPL